MRSKTIFGALLVSVALCSQGFGFELLDRMLGLNGGGCGECKACAKVACCAPNAKCCPEPTCCAKPQCEKVYVEQTRCKVKKCHATPVRDLFDNLKDMFEAKGCVCEPACCGHAKCCAEPVCCAKPKCCEKACCEPTCCEKVKQRCHKFLCREKGCCEPTCCEKAKCCAKPCCEPTCCEKPCKEKCHKLYRRPLVELLENMFGDLRHENGCEVGCCEATCGVCGPAPCNRCPAPAAAPAKTPAKAPEQAAPLPKAPKADPSASVESRGIYQASRSLVRN